MTGDKALRQLDLHRQQATKAGARFIDLQRLQMRYGYEGFLRRLEKSSHRRDFVLKGAMLFVTLGESDTRNTKDADFQVYGKHTPPSLRSLFAEVCRMDVDDGLTFDADRIEVSAAGAERAYPGFEVRVPAKLGRVALKLLFDIGFGEAITPAPREILVPTLLDHPDPTLRAYPWETVIAEKFEAMVDLGMRNNRMKDFHDLAELASRVEFDGSVLTEALKQTFERRKTAIPTSRPIALTEEFYRDRQKQTDWRAFLTRHALPKRLTLEESCQAIESFLLPVVKAMAQGKAPPDHWADGKWT